MSTSGWSTSWGGSGSTITLNITNNTGTDHIIVGGNFNSNAGGRDLISCQYTNTSGTVVYTYQATTQFGTPGTGEHYGQNHYGFVPVEGRKSSDQTAGNVSFAQYSSGGIDEGGAIDGFMHNCNTRKKDGDTRYAGPTPAGATGTAGAFGNNFLEALKVNSTKVRIRWIGSLAGGGFTANTGGPATYQIFDVTPGKYSFTIVLLSPTVSKLHPPLYELRTDIPILDIILSNPKLIDFIYLFTQSSKVRFLKRFLLNL